MILPTTILYENHLYKEYLTFFFLTWLFYFTLKIQDESYTSKLCSKCGEINNTLGSSKVFNCNKCNLHYDRDMNSCRNILIKSLN